MPRSAPRVALLLPPTQSFFMPYAAPAVLAAWLGDRHSAVVVIKDCGIEWLDSQMERSGTTAARLQELRSPHAYQNVAILHEAYVSASAALSAITSKFHPETVGLDGQHSPGQTLATWPAVQSAADSPDRASFFDEYFDSDLLPWLRDFSPDFIGMSVPFDWMIFPTVRLCARIRTALPEVPTIVGGHAIRRLWYEKEHGFFESLQATWACEGERRGRVRRLDHRPRGQADRRYFERAGEVARSLQHQSARLRGSRLPSKRTGT
jgi:hypothetical protein